MSFPTERAADVELSLSVELPVDFTDLALSISGEPFKLQLWPWQFSRAAQGAPQCVRFDDHAGRCVAFNGLIPVEVYAGGASHPAFWSCDFFVSEALRGKGIGTGLKQELKARAALVLAMGISDAAESTHRKSGWMSGRPNVRTVYRSVLGTSLAATARRILQRSALVLLGPLRGAAGDVETCDVKDCVKELDQIWSRVRSGYDAAVERKADYLYWRYAGHPLADYLALIFRDSAGLARAAAIIRVDADESVLCDFIGRSDDFHARRVLVRAFAQRAALSCSLSCTTNDSGLLLALVANGFVGRPGTSLRFNIQDAQNVGFASRKWFLMGGDSDGELLAAGRAGPPVTTEVWGENEFLANREVWDRLLQASWADRLFMSWEWLSTWWTHFRRESAAELCIFIVRDDSHEIVAAYPLCLIRSPVRPGMMVRRLVPLGSRAAAAGGMRTEYWSPLCRPGYERVAAGAVCAAAAVSLRVHEVIIPDADLASPSVIALRAQLGQFAYLRKPVAEDDGYLVPTGSGFQALKGSMGGGTRRRLFGQQRKLEQAGIKPKLVYTDRVDEALAVLNRMHVARWGQGAFEGAKLVFNQDIAIAAAARGELRISYLIRGSEPVSVAYGIRAGTREYNLQLGFVEAENIRASLGYAHLGLIMEDCHRDGIDYLDLLAGPGKNSNYKALLAPERRSMGAIHAVLSARLALLYRLWDWGRAVSK